MSSQALTALLAIACVQGVTDLAVVFLRRKETQLARYLPFLISAAAGVLLATACLDLLPEAVQRGHAGWNVWGTLLVSLLVLFCLEALGQNGQENSAEDPRLEPHAHHHYAGGDLISHEHGLVSLQARRTPRVSSLLVGSSIHSAVDGLAIAAAFAAGTRAGWSAAVAVCLHELPHRLSDYSIMVKRGVPGGRAAQLAITVGAAAILGGLLVVSFGERAGSGNWLLPVSAASFLYIALVDLVPELQAHRKRSRVLWEILCLLGGAAWIAAAARWMGE